MTKLLEQALAKVRLWPRERQDEVAQMLLDMEGDVYVLSDQELADVEQGLEEVDRGELATESEVQALLQKHGL